MSYSHSLWGVNLTTLTSIHGSMKESIVDEIVSSLDEELEDNDAFFEDEIEDGDCPTTETALRQIAQGGDFVADAPAMYGYALQILCQHIGRSIDHDEIAAVRDHPYESALTASGPPIAIPYDKSDFPEIGFIDSSDIAKEIAAIDTSPRPSDQDLADDVAAYRAALQDALDNNLSVVSFRH